MEIIENEKNMKSNYKKLIWILIVFNIIFLLAIFGLNYACYSALESKCDDNIQLSTNTNKQDKKNAFDNTEKNKFIDGLNYLGYPNFYFNSMNNDSIEDFLSTEMYVLGNSSNFNLNGAYNFFIDIYCEFEYVDFILGYDEPYFEFYFGYDYYDNVGSNVYFSENMKPYLNNVGEFFGSEGSYRFSLSSSYSSLTYHRTRSLKYDIVNTDNVAYFYFDNFIYDGFDFTQYTKFEFLLYFVPVADSSELGNYQAGYDKGYQDGLNDADVYDYAEQYYNNGFNAGYQEGIQKGIEESGNNILGNMLLSIFDVPLMYLSSLLNFNLLGINLLGLLGAILCIGLIAFLIKKLL